MRIPHGHTRGGGYPAPNNHEEPLCLYSR